MTRLGPTRVDLTRKRRHFPRGGSQVRSGDGTLYGKWAGVFDADRVTVAMISVGADHRVVSGFI